MASSEFWHAVGVKFRSIFDPGSQLYAKWKHPDSDSNDTRWEICGESSAEERNQFLVLARFAGSKLIPDSPDPLRAWLNKLKSTRPEYDRDTREYTQPDGARQSWEFGTVREICRASANLCDELELVAMVGGIHPEVAWATHINLRRARQNIRVNLSAATQVEPKALVDSYLSSFAEKIMILDICWAAKQRYREWTRWTSGRLKPTSKAAMAFRAVLTSGKRPEEYRLEPRPKGWK